MLQIDIDGADGATRRVEVMGDCVIGRGARSEVRLDGWRIGKEHARLFTTPSGVLLEDMGTFAGVHVNGRRIDRQYGPIRAHDVIGIAAFRLRVRALGAAGPMRSAEIVDGEVMARSRMATAGSAALAAASVSELRVAERDFLTKEGNVVAGVACAAGGAGHRDADHDRESGRTLGTKATARARRAAGANRADEANAADAADQTYGARPAGPARHIGRAVDSGADCTAESGSDARKRLEFEWRTRLHAQLLETMDLRRQDVHSMSDERLRHAAESLLQEILRDDEARIPRELDRPRLCQQVLDEAVGLGPLEALLADESVSEIMVNRHDEIYVERDGRLQLHPLTFTGERAVMAVIERIVAPLGRRIDESSPMVDARLKDGSRVNAIIPPLALRGPCLTIRKFAQRALGVGDLVDFDTLSPAMAEFLEVCVVSRRNVVVSGGTGAGKTTLLNILSNFIPPGERIVTIEDAAELKLNHAHLVSLEARPANIEGKGAVTIRELVRNTLRMRPDRIVVGECRGAEALDMLQAMNTGHEGSLTTLHANSPRDALARLETMVLMAGMELPLIAIREQIASAVNIIVQQNRFGCGTRVVSSISEVTGMESGKIQLQELFRFDNHGYRGSDAKVSGVFTGCDIVPTFYEELRALDCALELAIFKPTEPGTPGFVGRHGSYAERQSGRPA